MSRMDEANGQLHVLSDTTMSTESSQTTTVAATPALVDGGANCVLPTAFSDPDHPVNVVTAVITGLYLFFGLFAALFGYRSVHYYNFKTKVINYVD